MKDGRNFIKPVVGYMKRIIAKDVLMFQKRPYGVVATSGNVFLIITLRIVVIALIMLALYMPMFEMGQLAG